MRTWAGDEHVVDRSGQLVEESVESVEVRGVEGGDAGTEFEAGTVQGVRVASGDNHLGPLLAGKPGRLEANPGAAADHEEGLPEQAPLALSGHRTHLAAISLGCWVAAICLRSDFSASR